MEYNTKNAPYEREKTFNNFPPTLPDKTEILVKKIQSLDDESLMRALPPSVKTYYYNLYLDYQLLYEPIKETLNYISPNYVDTYLDGDKAKEFIDDVRSILFEKDHKEYVIRELIHDFQKELKKLPTVESENRQESLEEFLINAELTYGAKEYPYDVLNKAFDAENNLDFQKLCFKDALEHSMENMLRLMDVNPDLTVDQKTTEKMLDSYQKKLINNETIDYSVNEALNEYYYERDDYIR